MGVVLLKMLRTFLKINDRFIEYKDPSFKIIHVRSITENTKNFVLNK